MGIFPSVPKTETTRVYHLSRKLRVLLLALSRFTEYVSNSSVHNCNNNTMGHACHDSNRYNVVVVVFLLIISSQSSNFILSCRCAG